MKWRVYVNEFMLSRSERLGKPNSFFVLLHFIFSDSAGESATVYFGNTHIKEVPDATINVGTGVVLEQVLTFRCHPCLFK